MIADSTRLDRDGFHPDRHTAALMAAEPDDEEPEETCQQTTTVSDPPERVLVGNVNRALLLREAARRLTQANELLHRLEDSDPCFALTTEIRRGIGQLDAAFESAPATERVNGSSAVSS